MSLILLLFCVKNLRVVMGYELIITIMIFGDFEPSCCSFPFVVRAKRVARCQDSSRHT